jgi:hypothetical protein
MRIKYHVELNPENNQTDIFDPLERFVFRHAV